MDYKKTEFPCIALRGMVLFPKTSITFDVIRKKSLDALEYAIENNKPVYITSQIDPSVEEPDKSELNKVGTMAVIKQMLKFSGNLVRVVAEGIERSEIVEILDENPFYRVLVDRLPENPEDNDPIRREALIRVLHDEFEIYAELSGKLPPDVILSVLSEDGEPETLTNLVASKIDIDFYSKQRLLEETNVLNRLELLISLISRENELLKIQSEITRRSRSKIDKTQRDYFLRQQIRTIQEELGDKEDSLDDAAEYAKKMEGLHLPEIVAIKLEKEIKRFRKMTAASAESTVSRDYIELVLELPWNNKTKISNDIKKCAKILDDDHYGLAKVKERIVEFLAVQAFHEADDAPIICLVGPPGVGKTSIAKSIARALNRQYIRMSLGGVRDEAEIRGHRRTYVGSRPGRIIEALKLAGNRNPLILLDELDKMSSDYKGDPTSALLEVLDREQNHTFRDHYLELPFDLGDVFFVCTANTTEGIPYALKDRLEIIEISSYTGEEKYNIALKYLYTKQLKRHGLKRKDLKIRKEAIEDMVSYYTKESGVRQLERCIEDICRKTVKKMLMGESFGVTVTSQNLSDYLGRRKFTFDKITGKSEVGVVRGLAWTNFGGDTILVEANKMEGKGKFELTGNMGDVMQESAKASVSFVRANSNTFVNIAPDFYKETDIHIHVSESATPKNGPSAGITIATAIVSALTGVPVKSNVAMTGEITLRGRVLKIGGLKEKILAAKRAGIKTVIFPKENEEDLKIMDSYITNGLNLMPVSEMREVLEIAMEGDVLL